MKKLLLALLLLAPLLTLRAELIENGDFTKGRARWSGDGNVVALDAEGNKTEKTEAGEGVAGYALEIHLHASDWSKLEQRLNTASQPEKLVFSAEFQFLSDYAPLADSPAYSTDPEVVDWKPDGWYYDLHKVVFPKAGFVVRAVSNSFYYAPRTLPNDGAWRQVRFDYGILRNRERTLTFMFPPGTGTVRIRNVQQN